MEGVAVLGGIALNDMLAPSLGKVSKFESFWPANKACTADSSMPWVRAKAARLAISGKGPSPVISLILLPSGKTCKPVPGKVSAASSCRSALSIWPVSSVENSPPAAGGAVLGGPPVLSGTLGETGLTGKKLKLVSMGSFS